VDDAIAEAERLSSKDPLFEYRNPVTLEVDRGTVDDRIHGRVGRGVTAHNDVKGRLTFQEFSEMLHFVRKPNCENNMTILVPVAKVLGTDVVGSREVYDLTMKGPPNFVAGGHVVHNCIGRRNYREFFVFVGTTVVGTCYIIALSFVLFFHRARMDAEAVSGGERFVHILRTLPDVVAMDVVLFLVVWPVGMLFFFHVSLVAGGSSTNESIKKIYYTPRRGRNRLVFWTESCCTTFCRSVPPSWVGGLRRRIQVRDAPPRIDVPDLVSIVVIPDSSSSAN
jgi:hypothetical protein